MKKALNIIKSFIGYMGAYFMITVLFLTLVSGEDRYFDPKYYGVAILFSLLLALTHFIFYIKFIPAAVLPIIHIVLSTVSFMIAFIFVSNIIARNTAFVGTIAFAFIDIVCMVIRTIYVSALKKREENSTIN